MKKPYVKFQFVALLLGALFTGSVSMARPMVDVDQLNQKLQKSRTGWVAKDNWLNQMSPEEAKHLLGLQGAPTAVVEFALPQGSDKANLPAALDWRNKDGKNWVSPILNQANCGSCVAFAAVGALETQINISSLLPTLNTRLSTQNLFSCGGGSCDYGWMPESAASTLMKKGVTDEACMPYRSGATGQDVACSAVCTNSAERTFKISNYSTPSRGSVDLQAVKTALQKGPLVTTLTVYADFMTYASGVYKHSTGAALGGHAVSIVGYDDATQSFIIRNSWSQEWGENGFAHVAYSDTSGIGRSTWLYEVPATTGSVFVENPRDYDYLSGTVNMKATSTYANTDSIAVSVFDQNNHAMMSSNCSSGSCAMPFESSQLADGRYEVQALAMNNKGEKMGSSTRQFFYVANQKPTMKVSFAGTNGTDLTKPLTGRIEVKLGVQSSSVPFSLIEFHYRDSQGVEKIKSAQVVIDGMTMGWRTNLVPNGTYEIWMTGHIKTNQTDYTAESAHMTVKTQN